MDLRPFVATLRTELAVAAEAGGPEARALAERLTAPLESAASLVLLEALSAAADEITRELAPGSVEVRLRGRDPGFVVALPPADEPAAAPLPPAAPVDIEDGATSRINLRLPDALKTRIEEAAARERLSLNAWLVRAAAAAVGGSGPAEQQARSAPRSAQRLTGWVR